MGQRLDTPAATVTSPEQMDGVLAAVRDAGRMGLDTEFLREKTYFARLCLAQVATPEQVFLIDPVRGADAFGLSELLADPAIEVVVHAGWQDLQLFYQRAGCVPANVFDIQLAAGFAGLSASLAYGRLVQELTGVELEKGEAYTDWCRRPLTDKQLSYAADDVRYLLPAADQLKSKLAQLDRTQWLAEEMAYLETPEAYAADEEVWRKVAGQGTLSPRQAAILRELARWREDAAAQRDLPRGWLIKDATLIEIARRSPASVGELKAIRGIDAREAERSGPGMLRAIERGAQAAPIKRPPMPNKTVQVRARMIGGLADAILRAHAEGAGIAPELVGSRSEMDALLVAALSGHVGETENRLLHGWRKDLAGDAIVALASGQCALRVIDRPPFIEELPIES
ncbi:MAG TPA: ribonuclease D [Chloroflexota bacterium]|nr:ribonuclease D [Chloroflexota bacterium]